MSAARIYAVFLRQVYLIRGSFTRVIPMFFWIAIDMVLWGFIARYLNKVSGAALDFTPLLLGAVLLWDFFVRVMQGVTMAFFEDVWSRNFLNVFATPLKSYEYAAGLVATSVATSILGLIVMLALATAIFGLPVFDYGLMLLPFLLTLFLFGIALGIFGCALVLRFGPASEWLIWPIPALLSPFAGVFYPLATLPAWMQWIGHALPPSYIFEAMRAIVAGQPASLPGLAISVGLSALYIVLAAWFFARIQRRALQTGLIARYSAESIN